MPSCVFTFCKNYYCKVNKKKGISYHSFPTNKDRLQEWITIVRKQRNEIKWKPSKGSTICSHHFKTSDKYISNKGRIQIRKSAIPILEKCSHSNHCYRCQTENASTSDTEVTLESPGKATLIKPLAAMTEAVSQIQKTEAESGTTLECRACLQILNADSVLYDLFGSWTLPWDGMENSIADDLAKIANVQILETDRHSKIICESCCQLLLSACSFTATVKKNDQILQQRYGEDTKDLNLSNDRVWPKPIQVDKSLASSMYENPMNVDIKQEILSDDDNEYPITNGSYDTCKEEIPNLDIIKIEPEEMIQQQPLQIQVAVNGNVPVDPLNSSVSHLTNGNSDNGEHLLAKIKEEPLSEDEDTDPLHSDLPLECMLCAKVFNSVSGLKAHVIAQHSYKSVKRKRVNSLSPEKKKCKYICAICRRTFTTSTDLMVHETCHNKSVCYGCNESFDTFAQLTTHRRTCKAIANKEVTKLKTLDDVLRPQPKEQINELKCPLCDETFTDMYYMNIHQEIHHLNNEENNQNCMEVENLESIFTANKEA